MNSIKNIACQIDISKYKKKRLLAEAKSLEFKTFSTICERMDDLDGVPNPRRRSTKSYERITNKKSKKRALGRSKTLLFFLDQIKVQ